ncbi:LTA synthase family protein [Vreelandella zhaodongensis]|uniref:LTA synthase family protein n=1 Tax=Vreelandella zhaodongensis TaxID=1176240 RepID=A0ABX2SMB2_VREZH|nr:LTA synthase family protein [Halomonas zhaodongensis]NYS43432.1 LTA synthase family protein [Halomonas zhaodongensis]
MQLLASPVLMGPLLAGLLFSLLFEALLKPRPQPCWQRSLAANMVHLGCWLLLFGLFVLILQRPWFAVVFILSLQLVVVQASNTKSRTLNEPFICHDFEYFWDAILHPRLYVPFFGIGLAIAASSAGAVAIGSFFYVEPPLTNQKGVTAFLLSSVSLITTGALIVWLGWRQLPSITLDPAADLDHLGLFSSLWSYGIALARSHAPAPTTSPFYALAQSTAEQSTAEQSTAKQSTVANGATAMPPNVVLVQSESFFDPRAWCEDVAADLLPNYDATRAGALLYGTLNVPAWGANTVRTESAVLTGLPPKTWGARQFNPYRTLSRHTMPSIASAFKAQGYRTVCVHPYPATFYLRDRVIPKLGFESFIDINAFSSQDKHGQYISDQAVARKVGRLLEDGDNRPLFVFVITMENHGPLHLEAPDRATLAKTLPNAAWPLPNYLRDLAVYLQHLSEADHMLGSVKAALQSASRPGLLGWYGDHVPILPDAYGHYSPPDGDTPYMIWSTQSDSALHTKLNSNLPDQPPAVQGSCTLSSNELGVQLFKQAFGRDISSDVIKAEPEPQEQE